MVSSNFVSIFELRPKVCTLRVLADKIAKKKLIKIGGHPVPQFHVVKKCFYVVGFLLIKFKLTTHDIYSCHKVTFNDVMQFRKVLMV